MTLGFRAPLFLLLLVSLQRTGEEGPALLMGSSQAFCGFSFLADGTPRGRSLGVFSLPCSELAPQLAPDGLTCFPQSFFLLLSPQLLQIYEQQGFLGLSNIKFRPGSVLVESALAFRKGSVDACGVKTQFEERGRDLLDRYDLSISGVTVQDVSFPSSGQSGSGVPGWAVALLVLVCVLVALTVCQCRRKNCGQLDIFPTRNAYHPMSEYPTYHTHGRYVPPGSGRRSPYEEVSAGNGGSGLSYVNPNPSATSANL
uniref:Mucin 1, cell surface associated n=1 Tax=Ursus maritimus TaxID=29073 RepID=A0A452V0I9_URSMA